MGDSIIEAMKKAQAAKRRRKSSPTPAPEPEPIRDVIPRKASEPDEDYYDEDEDREEQRPGFSLTKIMSATASLLRTQSLLTRNPEKAASLRQRAEEIESELEEYEACEDDYDDYDDYEDTEAITASLQKSIPSSTNVPPNSPHSYQCRCRNQFKLFNWHLNSYICPESLKPYNRYG